MQEMLVRSLGREEPLEEEMAIHSSTLAWETYGQRRLAGYSPWGHKGPGPDLATKHFLPQCRLLLKDHPHPFNAVPGQQRTHKKALIKLCS